MVREVGLVATKELVRALAVKNDCCQVLARQAHYAPLQVDGCTREGLLLVVVQRAGLFNESRWIGGHSVAVDPRRFDDHIDERAFGKCRIVVKATRERVLRDYAALVPYSGDQPNDHGGVEASGKAASHRNVRAQSHGNASLHNFAKPSDRIDLVISVVTRTEIRLPVAPRALDPSVLIYRQGVGRRKATNSAKHGQLVAFVVAAGDIPGGGGLVWRSGELWVCEQRFHLRRQHDPTARQRRVEQRLLAKTVTRHQ